MYSGKGLLILSLLKLFQYSLSLRPFVLCPRDQKSWKDRSNSLKCWKQGKDYHCLKHYKEDYFIELCLSARALLSAEGCPVLKYINNDHDLGQIPCLWNKTGCPDPNISMRFRSDKLYLYPACIKSTTNDSDKNVQSHFTGTTDDANLITTINSSEPVSREAPKVKLSRSSLRVTYLAVGIAVCLVVLVSLFMFTRRRIAIQRVQEGVHYTTADNNDETLVHVYHDINAYDEINDEDVTVREESKTPKTASEVGAFDASINEKKGNSVTPVDRNIIVQCTKEKGIPFSLPKESSERLNQETSSEETEESEGTNGNYLKPGIPLHLQS